MADTREIWLPISIFLFGEANCGFYFFRGLEIAALFLALIVTVIGIVLALRYKVYHYNMIIFYALFCGQWFEMFLARFLTMPYQDGWISIADLETIIDQNSNTPSFYLNDPKYTPLLIGGFLMTHYTCLVPFMLPMIVAERFFATEFVSNYENVPRKYISVIGCILAQICSIAMAFTTVFNIIDILVPVLALTILNLATFALLAFLIIRNRRLITHVNFQREVINYSIAKKYQLEENLRVLDVIYCVPVVIHVTPKWRRTCLDMGLKLIGLSDKGPKVKPPAASQIDLRQHSDLYFQGLKQIW
ncbi:unnamed protein product [Caenorhabditis auriculariae]|uniref:Uncharacterized protein n=1 Tax=Caenorhabditis auriculariae TaxID=2777116 RepID=A0A8S1H4B4_9PELO|nr:unnamed protein product [Caenorhabditis auriculariae]